MIAGTVLFTSATWCIMLATYFLSRYRWLHPFVMTSIIGIDFAFPFYLYLTRDWGRRLFDEGEILSVLLWVHLSFVVTLYVLYVVQLQVGFSLLRDGSRLRKEHRAQGIGILVVRALVIFTGALLVESSYDVLV
jgi:hypothetical protein